MRRFDLVRTIEVDLPMREFGEVTPARVEILRSADEQTCFRFRLWALHHYRVQPSFPQDPPGFPSEDSCDDAVLIEYSAILPPHRWNDTEFRAESEKEAIEHVMALLDEAVGKWPR